jgi:glycosyltransferase involved in cell wall biosynthesis
MKIAYITAGAAGMYCGSCVRDNALARALMARGHDVSLIPTYTPTRTDEPNVSQPQIFLGGINVYLQHKSAVFRHTPSFMDRMLDARWLLNWASRRGVKTDGADLGSLTVSMLRGEDGPNQKEFLKLASWLAEHIRPDVVNLSNSLLIAAASSIRRRWNVPLVCSLTGEDLFMEGLPDQWRDEALGLLRHRVADVDAFITFSQDYAAFMSQFFQIPEDKMFVVPVGISLEGHSATTRHNNRTAAESAVSNGGATAAKQAPFVIGYLARVCPEKGLHVLCEAFRLIRGHERFAQARLRIAGYLGERDRPYWEQLQSQIEEWGLRDAIEYAGELDRAEKIQFLQSLDVFSVPSLSRESKGLPVLEAWANGVPVVQPWHSVYTELVNASQAGVLVPPNDPQALADAIAQLLDNAPLRAELGSRGRAAVEKMFSADRMAEATVGVYERLVQAAQNRDGAKNAIPSPAKRGEG